MVAWAAQTSPSNRRAETKLVDATSLSDEQLAAEAAREGSDGPAFVALVERFRPRVWRICYRLLSNEQDSNDAAQEVFVRLFLNRAKFAGRSKYSTWVHGIAVRTCLAQRRSRGRRQKHETLHHDAGWEAQQPRRAAGEPGLSMDLTRMLEVLDDEDRAILLLKYAEGYDYEELSAIFEISISACKMRVSRAREKLQQRFPELVSGAQPHG
jgi:RNA polymerase sigma-70 factor (ECF subfamily)